VYTFDKRKEEQYPSGFQEFATDMSGVLDSFINDSREESTILFAKEGEGTHLRMRHQGVSYVGLRVQMKRSRSAANKPIAMFLCLKPSPTAHEAAKQYWNSKGLEHEVRWFADRWVMHIKPRKGHTWCGGEFTQTMEAAPFLSADDMLKMEKECLMEVEGGEKVPVVEVRRMYPGVPLYIPQGYLHACCLLQPSVIMLKECIGEVYGLLKSIVYSRAFVSPILQQFSYRDRNGLMKFFVQQVTESILEGDVAPNEDEEALDGDNP